MAIINSPMLELQVVFYSIIVGIPVGLVTQAVNLPSKSISNQQEAMRNISPLAKLVSLRQV